jgi:hypothetical protein
VQGQERYKEGTRSDSGVHCLEQQVEVHGGYTQVQERYLKGKMGNKMVHFGVIVAFGVQRRISFERVQ